MPYQVKLVDKTGAYFAEVDTSGHLEVVVGAEIPAGTKNIGDVDVASHPTDTFAADAQAYGKGVLIQGDDGTDRRAILVGTDGHVQVDVLSSASHAVTNAGTFAVQATLATETTKVIGTVNVAASQTIGLAAGTAEIGKLAAGTANIGDVDIASALPAGTNLMGKVGIDQATANANEVVVKSGTVTAVTAITNALPAGTNNIGSVNLASSISEWSVVGTSEANTAATITKASGGGTTKHVITAIEVVIRGAAAGADISVALLDNVTVKWQTYFGVGAVRGERVGIVFAHGIEMTAATAVNLTVGAGGASVIAELNMAGYTKAA